MEICYHIIIYEFHYVQRLLEGTIINLKYNSGEGIHWRAVATGGQHLLE